MRSYEALLLDVLPFRVRTTQLTPHLLLLSVLRRQIPACVNGPTVWHQDGHVFLRTMLFLDLVTIQIFLLLLAQICKLICIGALNTLRVVLAELRHGLKLRAALMHVGKPAVL